MHQNKGSINNLKDSQSRFDTDEHTKGHESTDIPEEVEEDYPFMDDPIIRRELLIAE